MGQNFNKLVAHRASQIMVPPGGGIAAAVASITTPGKMAQATREAVQWVRTAISLVRTAAEPNPWRNASDEEIAGEILTKLEQKKQKARFTTPRPTPPPSS